ncbi:MAG TPA: hypothetical protein VFM75_02525, partial [Modicisalibacter sp.]|nr:hypothetical protein [Modicisalibacter sp.]
KQCQQQALQGPAGPALAGNPLDETNVSDYTSGEEYELLINFIGHGNTFYNVTCQVDEQGKVTFDSVEESGQPRT